MRDILAGAGRRIAPKLEEAGGKVAVAAAGAGVKAAQRAASVLAKPEVRTAALALGVTLAKVSLIGLAGVAAYYATKKLRQLRFKTYADLRFDLANQYRHARQAAAQAAGRDLTGPELAQFNAWHKQKLAEINQAEASGRSITGLQNLIFDEDR